MHKNLINESAMPAPRLELRWVRIKGWSHRKCFYNLVLPLKESDIRREDKDGNKVWNELTVQINQTEVTGSPLSPINDQRGYIETPFRDGMHAIWDSKALGGLPVYAVADGVAYLVLNR